MEGFEPGYIRRKAREGRRTDIEAMTEAVLLDMGIAYEFEKRIGRYWIDFYLPDKQIALECDGWMHARPYRRERDERRDAALTTRGIQVVRLLDADIRADARSTVLSALGL
jgi:very-short-patch-repair endonuclease